MCRNQSTPSGRKSVHGKSVLHNITTKRGNFDYFDLKIECNVIEVFFLNYVPKNLEIG